jgi:hypothetical protein
VIEDLIQRRQTRLAGGGQQADARRWGRQQLAGRLGWFEAGLPQPL